MQDLVILTGASRGLGLAMARQLVAPDRLLLCLSRHTNPELDTLAQAQGATVLQWPVDLADPAPVAARLQQWLSQLDAPSLASATLINNAGVIPEITPLEHCPPDGIARALRVGLEAPMLLTAAFLNASGAWVDAGWRGPRKVLNISSGLGRRAMAAQAPYCAAKAGMDHFSRCVALD
ncbi:SDR family NAD(P)-dependent oxidoreductase, partial [Hydrogenophaga sp. H7]